jgi:hypothetical protein
MLTTNGSFGPFMSIDTKGGMQTFAAVAKYRLTVRKSGRLAACGTFNRSDRPFRERKLRAILYMISAIEQCGFVFPQYFTQY